MDYFTLKLSNAMNEHMLWYFQSEDILDVEKNKLNVKRKLHVQKLERRNSNADQLKVMENLLIRKRIDNGKRWIES